MGSTPNKIVLSKWTKNLHTYKCNTKVTGYIRVLHNIFLYHNLRRMFTLIWGKPYTHGTR